MVRSLLVLATLTPIVASAAARGTMRKDEIQNRIRDLRLEFGEMTQQELADRVGCTRQTIHLLEYGRYSPSLGLTFRIARVFSLTVDEVFRYKGKRRRGETSGERRRARQLPAPAASLRSSAPLATALIPGHLRSTTYSRPASPAVEGRVPVPSP